MRSGIFIDDTGNAGNNTESIYDSPDRKSWLALILTQDERIRADYIMRGLIDGLKRDFGANEFHFKDIYNGQNQFKNIDLNIRKEIFQCFANIFNEMNYPMLIQTMTADDMKRNKLVYNNPKIKMDNFKLTNTGDFALFFLLFRIKVFLNSESSVSVPIDIIIDHGRQKPGTAQKVDMLKDMLFDRKIQYVSSHEEPLLQLVDYAAFALNRCRWILSHKSKSPLDHEMMAIFTSANFNVLNMVKEMVNLNGDTVTEYNKILETTYNKHNHLGELDLEKMIIDFYK